MKSAVTPILFINISEIGIQLMYNIYTFQINIKNWYIWIRVIDDNILTKINKELNGFQTHK